MINDKNKSLTENSIYFLAYNLLNVLFPLITGIYVARILLPDNIGKVAYAQNIAQYFVILSFLGIPTYGLREIAKIKDDNKKIDKLFTELVIINSISTVFFVVVYFSIVFYLQAYRSNLLLFGITGLMIVLNMLNISWLYEGLEEFKFISIRNIVFKIVSFIILICLVKDSGDYLQYALITVLGTAGNYLINVVNAKKIVRFRFGSIDLRRHLKPIGLLVIVNLAIEIYTLVDITMLGTMCNEKDVAFYSYASKINKIFIQILNSFTIVIVPRLSWYIHNGNKELFNQLLSKTLRIILIFSIPLIVGIQFCGKFIVCVMYGDIYLSSAYILRILSITLIVSPLGYLLGSRVMLVTGGESKMPICVGAGAVVNIICNFLLIPLYKGYGAAIASVIGEIVVITIYIIFSHKKFELLKVGNTFVKICAATSIMTVYLFFIKNIGMSELIEFLVQVIGGIVIYFAFLLCFKESIVKGYFLKVVDRIMPS